MTLSPDTLASLQEAARAIQVSSPAPWYLKPPHTVCDADGDEVIHTFANSAPYFALANPATVLALLDERASLASLANALLSRPQPDEGVRKAMLDASNTLLSRHGGGGGVEGRPELPSADAGPIPRSPHEPRPNGLDAMLSVMGARNHVIRATVLAEIADERRRQVEVEGWTPAHDDKHDGRELALAAACYASGNNRLVVAGPFSAKHPNGWHLIWPWGHEWWKPSTPRRSLIKAGALIVAEIERLDRLSDGTGRAPSPPVIEAEDSRDEKQ